MPGIQAQGPLPPPSGLLPANPVNIPEGLTPSARDPFWPVGYTPSGPKPTDSHPTVTLPPVSEPKWTEAKAALKIGGFMKSPRGFTALINNTLVSTGDVVSLVYEGHRYRWKIESITVGGITFIPLDCVRIGSQT
jgi:hypothetical protein